MISGKKCNITALSPEQTQTLQEVLYNCTLPRTNSNIIRSYSLNCQQNHAYFTPDLDMDACSWGHRHPSQYPCTLSGLLPHFYQTEPTHAIGSVSLAIDSTQQASCKARFGTARPTWVSYPGRVLPNHKPFLPRHTSNAHLTY